jgi:hypothetical protein
MPLAPINDPVISQLLQSGLPNTNENYNRMRQAMNVGGWSGGHQPYTADMARRARGYTPRHGEEGVDTEMPAAQPAMELPPESASQYDADMQEYMDSLAGDGRQSAPKVAKKTNATNNTTQTASGGKQAPSSVATADTEAPAEAAMMNEMQGPSYVDAKIGEVPESGITAGDALAGVMATLATIFGARHMRGGAGKAATQAAPNAFTQRATQPITDPSRLLPAPNKGKVFENEGTPKVVRDREAKAAEVKKQTKPMDDNEAMYLEEAKKQAPYKQGEAKRQANAQARKKVQDQLAKRKRQSGNKN